MSFWHKEISGGSVSGFDRLATKWHRRNCSSAKKLTPIAWELKAIESRLARSSCFVLFLVPRNCNNYETDVRPHTKAALLVLTPKSMVELIANAVWVANLSRISYYAYPDIRYPVSRYPVSWYHKGCRGDPWGGIELQMQILVLIQRSNQGSFLFAIECLSMV